MVNIFVTFFLCLKLLECYCFFIQVFNFQGLHVNNEVFSKKVRNEVARKFLLLSVKSPENEWSLSIYFTIFTSCKKSHLWLNIECYWMYPKVSHVLPTIYIIEISYPSYELLMSLGDLGIASIDNMKVHSFSFLPTEKK